MTDDSGNALEAALRRAAAEPGDRPAFYRLLLDSQVYVLGQSESGGEGVHTLQAGGRISIENWTRQDGSPVIPFFSSVEALQRAIAQESRYLGLPARSLFEMTRGATLVLDPKSEFGKEFVPGEIDALLAGGANRAPEVRVAAAGTQVLLGQPANQPTRMLQSLIRLLSGRSEVVAAYLALMHDASLDDAPRLIVGIETEGDVDAVLRDVGSVVADTAPEGEPVDIFHVKRGGGGLGDWVVQDVKPFYRRPWLRRLGESLGFRRH